MFVPLIVVCERSCVNGRESVLRPAAGMLTPSGADVLTDQLDTTTTSRTFQDALMQSQQNQARACASA